MVNEGVLSEKLVIDVGIDSSRDKAYYVGEG